MSDKKTKLKTVSLAIGATFATTLAASNIAGAAPAGDNPFAMTDLGSGYMQVADSHKGKEGKCGEGKKEETKKQEGKCGEGKCGEGKAKPKDAEGKCGEGKKPEGK